MISNHFAREGGVTLLLLLLSLTVGCATAPEKPSRLQQITLELVAQLQYGAGGNDAGISHQPLAITLFVEGEDQEVDSRFGNLLRSSLINELRHRGFQIIHHFDAIPAVQLLAGGDLASHTDILRIREQKGINHLLSGTVTEFENSTLIHLQIIDLESSSTVLSAISELSRQEYHYFMRDRNLKTEIKEKRNEF